MSKQLITIGGREMLVREDTAKRYRGMRWAFFTLVMMIVITALLFLAGVFKLASNGGNVQDPTNAGRQSVR